MESESRSQEGYSGYVQTWAPEPKPQKFSRKTFEPADPSRKNFDVIIFNRIFYSYLWTFTALKCTKLHYLMHIYIYYSLIQPTSTLGSWTTRPKHAQPHGSHSSLRYIITNTQQIINPQCKWQHKCSYIGMIGLLQAGACSSGARELEAPQIQM